MKRSLCSVLALAALVAAPAMAADIARYILPPGNFGGIPFTANSTDQLPLYSGLSPLRDNITPADIDQLLPSRGLHADRALPRGSDRAARPAAHLRRLGHPARLWTDAGGRRVRRGLGHGARPRPPDPARSWPGARRRRRRAQHRRVLAGHEPPVVHAEPGGRGAGDEAGAAPDRHLRRQGAGDPRATPRPTPTASTPTGRRTTSTSRPRPSTTSSR